jgi:hypothetical protein
MGILGSSVESVLSVAGQIDALNLPFRKALGGHLIQG